MMMRLSRSPGFLKPLLILQSVAFLAIVTGALFYVVAALPVTEGRLVAPGLRAEVQIERDTQGIPTIRASSAQDAWFGLGFAHAQDRLWQLETHRRIGAGRLAEAFGPGAIDSDRFLRVLGVRRRAELQWEQASPATRKMLASYADGINAFLHGHLRARPPEFMILGLEPEDWSPVDSLAWSTMMAWDLGGNWQTEMLRLRLTARMPVERIQQLLPPYPGDKPLVTGDYRTLYRQLGIATASPVASMGAPSGQALAEIGRGDLGLPWVAQTGVEGIGSNNWVVSGTRTVTGKPLLANDPHLKLSAPSLWYLARIEAPGLKVAGATIPGLPWIVLGQNEQVAWGYTNTGPDVQDLYIERVDPGDPRRYETPGGWASFDTAEETIRVKGGADVKLVTRRTRHGPVISDAPGVIAGLAWPAGPKGDRTHVLAMRWTALDLDASGSIDAALGMNRAQSVDDFVAAAAQTVAPMQNMVVADGQRIAMVAAGRVPIRKPENDLRGLAPAPGWDARYDWSGFVPAGETPRERDPSRGWIATANQRIHGAQYPHHLTSEWAQPYRQQRIERLLSARPLHSLDSLSAIQSDLLSGATQRLLPWLKHARSSHPLAAAAKRELEGFEGTMAAERAAPLIFWAWVRQLTRGVFADDLGVELFDRELANRSFRPALEGVLERNDSSWCDDRSTPALETCTDQSNAALGRAMTELQALLGDDVASWRWGQVHLARAEHRPFSKVDWLARWFELRTPVGGDTFTVNVSRVGLKPDASTGELYLAEHGPGLRALYDLGDRRRSRVMFGTGQSGLFFSTRYRALVGPWARAEYLPLWGDGAPGDLLRLVPR